MGYYTSYELTVSPAEKGDEIEEFVDSLPNGAYGTATSWKDYAMNYEGGGDWSTNDSVKWYDHQEFMKELSKLYPDVLFSLHGEGEESGDIWKKYFKNGKVQITEAVIQLDDFDEKLLR